jgi:hypothetical protein
MQLDILKFAGFMCNENLSNILLSVYNKLQYNNYI